MAKAVFGGVLRGTPHYFLCQNRISGGVFRDNVRNISLLRRFMKICEDLSCNRTSLRSILRTMRCARMLILLLCSVASAAPLGVVNPGDWVEVPDANSNYTLFYSNSLKQHSWQGSFDPNGIGPQYEIRGKFDAKSTVRRGVGKKVAERYGMCQDFVWVDDVTGPGLIVLPTTGTRVFVAEGDYANPTFTTIGTDSSRRPYCEIDGGKTYVYIDHFSGAGISAFGGRVNLMPSIVAHWRLNDNEANPNVLDATGDNTLAWQHGNTNSDAATSGNPPYLTRALSFTSANSDSAGDFTLTTSLALSSFSISGWFKSDGTSGGNALDILSLFDASNNQEVLLETRDSDQFFLVRINNNNAHTGYTGLATPAGVWHHFVVTYTGTGGDIYIDGVDVDNLDNEGAIATITRAWIGSSGNSSGFFQGDIDNIMIFDKILSAAEIAYLFNGGVKPYSVHSGYGTERRTNVFNPIGGGIKNWSLK